jgi:hypothetical protein
MLDLTDDEKAARLKRTIEDDRYPLSPRLRPSRRYLQSSNPRDLLLGPIPRRSNISRRISRREPSAPLTAWSRSRPCRPPVRRI